MGSDVKCANPAPSGGLEELYTDFDAWITKRSWKFRQRIYPTTNERISEDKVAIGQHPTKTIIVDFQDCLVNGFSNSKDINTLYPEDLKGLIRFSKDGEEFVYIDFVVVRLVKENGRRRVMFVNRSKL